MLNVRAWAWSHEKWRRTLVYGLALPTKASMKTKVDSLEYSFRSSLAGFLLDEDHCVSCKRANATISTMARQFIQPNGTYRRGKKAAPYCLISKQRVFQRS